MPNHLLHVSANTAAREQYVKKMKFRIPFLIILILIFGCVHTPDVQKYNKIMEMTVNDIAILSAASFLYFDANKKWPSSINDLAAHYQNQLINGGLTNETILRVQSVINSTEALAIRAIDNNAIDIQIKSRKNYEGLIHLKIEDQPKVKDGSSFSFSLNADIKYGQYKSPVPQQEISKDDKIGEMIMKAIIAFLEAYSRTPF